eukprot:scaffold3349_cov246-Pinguiococcus_pyrenoidosus.AAC.10
MQSVRPQRSDHQELLEGQLVQLSPGQRQLLRLRLRQLVPLLESWRALEQVVGEALEPFNAGTEASDDCPGVVWQPIDG